MKSLFFILMTLSFAVMAQDDFDIQDQPQDQSIENSQMEITGEYSRPKPKSSADRARDHRRKLEKYNEMMVQKKIEQIRLKKEMELMKQLQQSFNESLTKIDQIK